MKTILCYGDSNTWGYIPGSGQRHAPDVRWPGVMHAQFGAGYRVLEEGLNARTTCMDDPTRPGRNGLTYLKPCLDSHAPLDLVVLMLGTNDCKHRFGLSSYDIAQNVAVLLNVIQATPCGVGGAVPPVLLLAPPVLGPFTILADLFVGAEERSAGLARHYRAVAESLRCQFLDAGAFVKVDPADGVHLDELSHRTLGEHLATAVRALLP
jgi:lysophospholipase L1-like esterase